LGLGFGFRFEFGVGIDLSLNLKGFCFLSKISSLFSNNSYQIHLHPIPLIFHFQDDDDGGDDEGGSLEVDPDLESRVLGLDLGKKEYAELERLQFQGRSEDVWRVVKKHLGNDRLVKYIYAYRQAQQRLGMAAQAIDKGDLRKLKTLLDEGFCINK
jgi:hypothetical protein